MSLERKFVVIIFVVAIFASVSSVSATTYTVNETWDNNMIQDFIDNTNDITGLHFTGNLGGVYNNIMLSIDKAVNITCDIGVVLSGFDDDGERWGTAFDVLANNVNISGFTITGYYQAISAYGVSNLTIVNNSFFDNNGGVYGEW